MKNYTTKMLMEMNTTTVKCIAKEVYSLPLSKDKKKFTKPELVKSIMKSQSQAKRKATMEAKKAKQVADHKPITNIHQKPDWSNINLGTGKTFHAKIINLFDSEKMATAVKNTGLDIGKPVGRPIVDEMMIVDSPLNVNKVETIVMQSRKLLQSANTQEELTTNIRHVENAIIELQNQVSAEKKNAFQNNKRNKMISLLNNLVTSYKKRGIQ